MNEDLFLNELVNLRRSAGDDFSSVESRFKSALLAVGSETEDNVACVEAIGYGVAEDMYGRPVMGLHLSESQALVSEVVHHTEGCSIPDEVREQFPKLSQKEWDAVLRLVTLILLSTEKRP